MPAFTEMRDYRFTDTQINLIVYALERLRGTMSDIEEREAEKVLDQVLESSVKRMDHDAPGPYADSEDFYSSYYTCDYWCINLWLFPCYSHGSFSIWQVCPLPYNTGSNEQN